MPRSYRYIQEYEPEIIRLREEGFSGRQICEKLGFSKKQYENFVTVTKAFNTHLIRISS